MEKVYTSVEELLSSCSSSELKNHVLWVLSENEPMQWELTSCSEEGAVRHSDFISRDEARGAVSHLSCELNEMGQFGHITVEFLDPSAVLK